MRTLMGMLCLALVACGGREAAADHPQGEEGGEPAGPRPASGPAIQSEIGALDQEAVDEAFQAARPAVARCFAEANRGLPFAVVGGELEVVVRVKNDGTVRWAYPSHSDLGHVGAERCILRALEQQAWPRPEGGEEGIARTRFGIDPPAPRPAVDWSAGELGSGGEELTRKLHGCLRSSGTTLLSLTMYLDADGKVLSAGAAIGDEAGLGAIECAVEAAKGMSFPSPGSYPAKVSLAVE